MNVVLNSLISCHSWPAHHSVRVTQIQFVHMQTLEPEKQVSFL